MLRQTSQVRIQLVHALTVPPELQDLRSSEPRKPKKAGPDPSFRTPNSTRKNGAKEEPRAQVAPNFPRKRLPVEPPKPSPKRISGPNPKTPSAEKKKAERTFCWCLRLRESRISTSRKRSPLLPFLWSYLGVSFLGMLPLTHHRIPGRGTATKWVKEIDDFLAGA